MADRKEPTSIFDSAVRLKLVDNGDGSFSVGTSGGAAATGTIGMPAGVPVGAAGPFNFGFSSAAAQTNTKLITVAAGTFVYLMRYGARLGKDVTAAKVAVRFGFAAAATPAAASCVDGHPGMDAGGGFNGPGGLAAKGGDGEDLIMDSDAATGGLLQVFGTYYTHTS